MKFRLTTTVEYKDDDLKALRHLAKESGLTPKEWLEMTALREGEECADMRIWEAVQYLFEQEEHDE